MQGILRLETNQYKILVVDDNEAFLGSVSIALKTFEVITASSIDDAKDSLSHNLDLVLLDLVFNDENPDDLQGMLLLEYIHNNYPNLQTIIMTNYSSTDVTVQAIKSGAADFLNKKELDWSEWKIRFENYCKNSARIRQLSEQNEALEKKYDDHEIIGESEQISFIRNRLKDLADNSDKVPIFITGETGTGKNLAVKYYRKHSNRCNKPFQEFSISELSESVLESELFGHSKGAFTGATNGRKGLFEEADGGILFLDEIGDYDLRIQKKIMRFIEDKTITPVGSTNSRTLNIQLIMATNQNIPRLIEERKFRADLYQRINRVRIELPPLRDRKKDIKVLSDYFFNHFKEKEKTNLKSIDPKVYETFEKYQWPGNIRELQSVIWDACTKARMYNDSKLSLGHIRSEIKEPKVESQNKTEASLADKKAEIELIEIDKALAEVSGKKEQAAKLLGMNADQLRYNILKHAKKHRINKCYKNINNYYGYLIDHN